FQIPAISALTLPPAVSSCGSNAIECSKFKKQYEYALASWQIIHASELNNFSRVRSWVHTQTDKIRNLSFPFDNQGSDIFGALATGAQNLQGVNAQSKYLTL